MFGQPRETNRVHRGSGQSRRKPKGSKTFANEQNESDTAQSTGATIWRDHRA
ncbi:hypothetical protein PHLCEN_2v4341 [Hermanssonia centrifuga]|uniref:Uncharacterized protein n=1 Tax=Hermanssonia centrifuga TaxID=98765 RepID=A0A2R6PVK4_9APHY|nr:hypothetical protein PHLCEN_2v4341 [Hermanssonia centrifuga]